MTFEETALDRTPPLEPARARRLSTAMRGASRDALKELYEWQFETVARAVVKALRHRADLVADATQDAWIRIATQMVQFDSTKALEAWLRRVATSAAIDLLRSELARRARERSVAQQPESAESFLADLDALDETTRALRILDQVAPASSALLGLRARTNATLAQLAAALGLGEAALERRLRRAATDARRALAVKQRAPHD